MVASDSPCSPGFNRVEAVKLTRSGSGVVQGDGGGGGGWAHAPRIATALAKTADIKQVLFMVRGYGACQHHVSHAIQDRASALYQGIMRRGCERGGQPERQPWGPGESDHASIMRVLQLVASNPVPDLDRVAAEAERADGFRSLPGAASMARLNLGTGQYGIPPSAGHERACSGPNPVSPGQQPLS